MRRSAPKLCGNCRSELKFLKRENVQLGKTGFFLGDWPNLFAGAQDLEFWVCPNCRKLEFFVPEGCHELRSIPEPEDDEDWGGEPGAMPQVTCPVCGAQYELDDPKCPGCGAKNTDLYGA